MYMGVIIKRGIVFGTFDGLHEGHKFFLDEVTRQCDELFVVVTTSEIVERLKGRVPFFNYDERVRKLMAFNPKLHVIPSDADMGTWKILRHIKPDAIFLGYDQEAIARELEKQHRSFQYIKAYQPEKFKSSLLKRKTS